MDENPVTGFFSHEKKHKKQHKKNVHLRYFSFHIVYQLSVHLDKRKRVLLAIVIKKMKKKQIQDGCDLR